MHFWIHWFISRGLSGQVGMFFFFYTTDKNTQLYSAYKDSVPQFHTTIKVSMSFKMLGDIQWGGSMPGFSMVLLSVSHRGWWCHLVAIQAMTFVVGFRAPKNPCLLGTQFHAPVPSQPLSRGPTPDYGASYLSA